MSMIATKMENIIFWKQFSLQIGASKTLVDYSIYYIVSPVGGDWWLLKNVFVIESFIQEIYTKIVIHSAMEQVKYLWVSHWIVQSNIFFYN